MLYLSFFPMIVNAGNSKALSQVPPKTCGLGGKLATGIPALTEAAAKVSDSKAKRLANVAKIKARLDEVIGKGKQIWANGANSSLVH